VEERFEKNKNKSKASLITPIIIKARIKVYRESCKITDKVFNLQVLISSPIQPEFKRTTIVSER
jgi:hypothetical protein